MYQDIFLIPQLFLCGFTLRPHLSATLLIRFPEWKVLNPQIIWNRVDGRIRILSNPMTFEAQIQPLTA